MGKLIAVEGLTIDHSFGSPVAGGTFTISTIPEIKVKCKGKGVYTFEINFIFAGGTHSAGTTGSAVASGKIEATATEVKVNGKSVMRLGDIGTMSGTYGITIPPFSQPFTSQIEIADANQNKVKAE